MNAALAVVAFVGPAFGAGVAWWLNEKSSERQREWALEDRRLDGAAREHAVIGEMESERRLWLRDLRREAYATVFVSDEELRHAAAEAAYPVRYTDLGTAQTVAIEAIMRLNAAVAAAMILAGPSVQVATEELRESAVADAQMMLLEDQSNDRAAAAQRHRAAAALFLAAIQQELGVNVPAR